MHTKLSPAEIAKLAEQNKRSSKGDQTRHDTILKVESERDILFGIWANVLGRPKYGIGI